MRCRAIAVVTEGVSVDLLRRWTSRGLLPAFAHLLAHGASGPLDSNAVPYEPPGLLAAFTGQPPGAHGWFSYWSAHAHDYVPRPLTSADLTSPFLWQRPELASRQFGVINLFGTFPPTPLNGYLIAYPTEQSLRVCYPRDLLFELSRRQLSCSHDVSVWFDGQAQAPFVSDVLEADARRGRIALDFWRRGVDAVVVNLTAIDRLSHCYWQELEAGSPVAETDSAVFRAYATADRVLAWLVDALDDGASLLAFSEIGFGPLRAYCPVNAQLEAAGLLKRGNSADLASKDPRGIAWDRTAAFEAVQGTHGVNINVIGRYREGCVPTSSYERTRRDTIDALRAQINPYTGRPLFADVLTREDVYEGAALERAPDIILRPADERYLPFGDPYWAEHVRRRLHSGWHRRGSYWAGVGEAFAAASGTRTEAASTEAASLLDIAPTIFAMLGEAIPRDLGGEPLTEPQSVRSARTGSMRVPLRAPT